MLEREVENILEQKLISRGWIINVGDKNRNVYRQSPRTEEENNIKQELFDYKVN